MLDKEIYSYLNTLDNLKALLKAKQRGISTDGQKNWCYKDGSNQLHVGADQKYWNGSAWVYASNEFGATTFCGNLALGANTINYDGSADHGIVFTSSQQLIIKNTDGIILGDAKQMVSIRENTGSGNEGNGAGISFHGNDGASATKLFGGIKAYKENSTTGNYDASVYIQTRANGSAPANAIRLDSSQNGYIKNKLMVGSLTETPTVNLAVYSDSFLNACLLSVSDAFSGPNAGLVIGVDEVVRTNGVPSNSQCVIRAEGYGRDIYVQSETATPNVFDTFIACEKLNWYDDYKTVTIADKLVVDGDAQVNGLTASQIVETDANKKLISVPKGTAYNANFGTGSSNVCRGDDFRLSNARTPINNDYYVQGSSSTRTTNAATTDVDSYSQSGFYRATNAPHAPTGAGYGIIHANSSNPDAFQLASRWNANRLYYRTKSSDTWSSWVELYHTGNLNPVDFSLTTHKHDALYAALSHNHTIEDITGTRTTDAARTDVNSYSKSGFYKATTTAPNLPTAADGYGIIHTNYTSDQYAFQLASRWDANNIFYRRKQNDTWAPWVELYHSGNLNPVDVDYSSISTVVGFSGTPAVNIKYREILGGLVVVRFSISGTSNSTRFYFSLPFTALSELPSGVCSYASDNSSEVLTPVKITVDVDGRVYLDKGDWSSSGDGWTASNGKAATGTIVFLRE